ncbi:hypothetical protein H7J06_10305 [Mycobacterium hodleri]|uniref:hypothetical protein n=1 Tax=Mycolicibacterium hodleri TaxID=49897 RepID=UPI0021F3A782|nr:hypothetical protein [Mycolicibacterium hodleri]MCV7133375.1 hypothetical protein [Mycolicibacterium hodleri]
MDPRDDLTVFGQEYHTPDGATIIPVSKPVGVFVVKDGTPVWSPASDDTRIALLGIVVGLVATVLAGITMVRRPPWPDLRGDVSKHS